MLQEPRAPEASSLDRAALVRPPRATRVRTGPARLSALWLQSCGVTAVGRARPARNHAVSTARRARCLVDAAVARGSPIRVRLANRTPGRAARRPAAMASDPCVPFPGRKPWLLSEKVGAKMGYSTCITACWIIRSTTVGIPNVLVPPSALGISSLRIACGT